MPITKTRSSNICFISVWSLYKARFPAHSVTTQRVSNTNNDTSWQLSCSRNKQFFSKLFKKFLFSFPFCFFNLIYIYMCGTVRTWSTLWIFLVHSRTPDKLSTPDNFGFFPRYVQKFFGNRIILQPRRIYFWQLFLSDCAERSLC